MGMWLQQLIVAMNKKCMYIKKNAGFNTALHLNNIFFTIRRQVIFILYLLYLTIIY